MIKVGVVEDEMIIAESICLALRKCNYDVVGPAMNFDDAIKIFKHEIPDILLMDINLKDVRDGIDLAGIINQNFRIPVIFLSANADARTIERSKAARPRTFLVKPFKPEELYSAIEIALFNHKLDLEDDKDSIGGISRSVCDQFDITERELEIIYCVAEGRKQRAIAIELDISEATVKRHLSNVFEKLGVNSSLEMLLKLRK
jgi:DNA-binding NarL/FixJ family response regulator